MIEEKPFFFFLFLLPAVMNELISFHALTGGNEVFSLHSPDYFFFFL